MKRKASGFFACVALGALGCVELRYPAGDSGAATDAPAPIDAIDAADASDAPDVVDVSDARDAVIVSDAPDAGDALDARDAPDVTDAVDASDARDASDVADAMDVMDVVDAPDAADVADVADARDAADVADAVDAMDVPFVVDALFLDSPSARDSSDVPRDVAPFWGMLTLRNATATFSQESYSVVEAIDGQITEGIGWAIAPRMAGAVEPQTAAFEFESTTPFSATGTRVVVRLINSNIGFRLAYFRLSLTSSPRDQFADGRVTLGDPSGTAVWITPNVTVSSVPAITITAVGPLVLTDESFNRATYTVTIDTPNSQFTGIRLEALHNASLSTGGPGTGTGINPGNFSLTEIQVTVSPR